MNHDRSSRAMAGRPFPVIAVVLAVVVIVTGTTVASRADAEALLGARAAARAELVAASAHRTGIGSTSLSLVEIRTAATTALARTELDRAAAALAASSGRAADATRARLQNAADSVSRSVASGRPSLEKVYALREAEKAVTDEMSAWQLAESARLAAEEAAAAAAAEAAAAEAQRHDSAAQPRRSQGAAVAAPPPAAAPVNDDCGPCPGATLVPIVVDGVTYWGCP